MKKVLSMTKDVANYDYYLLKFYKAMIYSRLNRVSINWTKKKFMFFKS